MYEDFRNILNLICNLLRKKEKIKHARARFYSLKRIQNRQYSFFITNLPISSNKYRTKCERNEHTMIIYYIYNTKNLRVA